MAEPDQLDFNTVAHAQWGVIEGCLVTVSGTTAIINSGIAVVNGKLVAVNAAEIVVGTGSGQDRFDLIVVDAAGTPKIVIGDPSLDPVFPDVPTDSTVLAAVFIAAGAPTLTDTVIDKRKFVAKNLLTKLAPGTDLIRNVNGVGDYYKVDAEGQTTWSGDTIVSRSAPATLRVQKRLKVDERIDTGDLYATGKVDADGPITGSNIWFQPGFQPVGAPMGALWQRSNGRLYLNTTTGWQELATTAAAVPVGAILQSLQAPDYMRQFGWIPMTGQRVYESDVPSLFTIPALYPYRSGGVVGQRSMTLPDLTHRVLVQKPTAGWLGPTARPTINRINLGVNQIPRHKHNVNETEDASGGRVEIDTAPAGFHTHEVQESGRHTHPVKDPGHRHQGMDLDGTGRYPSPVIGLCWGGQNKIDALFNDNNHTFSVEDFRWTMEAPTGITIGEYGSAHSHTVIGNGGHRHDLTIRGSELIHRHAITEDEVGLGADIDITPSFFAVYTYIRT